MQFAEISHDYIWGEVVENGLSRRASGPLLAAVSIDAWETGDDDEEGRVVANVLLSRHGDIIVDFHDNGARMDQQVLEHIAKAEAELRRIWEEYSAVQRQAVGHVKSLGCTAEVVVPRNVMERIKGYLNAASGHESQGEKYSIIYTVQFPDGIQMDIKCCVRQDEPSWTEAVLFDEYGNQLCCTEPDYSFDGPWELQYEGILYTVNIKTDPT